MEDETRRDTGVIAVIHLSGTVIISLLTVCQVTTSVVFYLRARKVKEINWKPKLIIGIANVDGIFEVLYFMASIYNSFKAPPLLTLAVQVVRISIYPIIIGFLIQFQRVQVQLRAQEENITKILKTIQRANILEKVFIASLITSGIC